MHARILKFEPVTKNQSIMGLSFIVVSTTSVASQ
jgi:hypothetical protein